MGESETLWSRADKARHEHNAAVAHANQLNEAAIAAENAAIESGEVRPEPTAAEKA